MAKRVKDVNGMQETGVTQDPGPARPDKTQSAVNRDSHWSDI